MQIAKDKHQDLYRLDLEEGDRVTINGCTVRYSQGSLWSETDLRDCLDNPHDLPEDMSANGM